MIIHTALASVQITNKDLLILVPQCEDRIILSHILQRIGAKLKEEDLDVIQEFMGPKISVRDQRLLGVMKQLIEVCK